jgi:hypothetical protein
MGLLQKIVKNDAMKEDPPEIYGWKVYFLAFSVRQTVGLYHVKSNGITRHASVVCCSV